MTDSARGGATAAAAGHVKQIRLAAVRAHDGGQQAVGIGAVLQNGRARAIAEQHAGVAVLPVNDGRKFFRADDQHSVVGAGHDKLLADFQAVNESGTGGFEIEGGGAVRADFLLHQAGGGGKRHVWRDGGDDDEVNLIGGDAGVFHARAARLWSPDRR